jgi:2-C-methyl-D-erythritol 2,4-cyclodiphosphate synthase
LASIRIGNGFDIHRLVPGRALVLGGVHIPFARGLEGFSDADVLTHAIIDSLLGAAGLGDIGMWFPPGDPRYAGAQSTSLLQTVVGMLSEKSWRVINVDTTILCEEPRLTPFISAMKQSLSAAMLVDEAQLSIKATTMEKLGEIGRGEAIAAMACALIEKGG